MKITTTKLGEASYGATDGEFDGIGSTRAEAVKHCREAREAAAIDRKIEDVENRRRDQDERERYGSY